MDTERPKTCTTPLLRTALTLPEIEDTLDASQRCYMDACHNYGVVPLKKILRAVNQRQLSIQYLNIGPKGGKALADTLKVNTVIEEVDLTCNGLEDKGTVALVRVLYTNPFIVKLNLSGNHISAEGGKVLGEVLKHNPSLEELDLSGELNMDENIIPLIRSEVNKI